MANLSRVASSTPPLVIWLLTDNKPGHKNQLLGLAERLQELAQVEIHWVETAPLDISWQDLLLRRWSEDVTNLADAGTPDIVIGAGHRTHKALLTAKRHFRCFGVVLMKPSLPIRSFDAAIIPAHDAPPERDNVLITDGVLNTITPSATINGNNFLILIGGDSKHYQWDSDAIISQLNQLTSVHPDQQFILTDSRRTPEAFQAQLNAKLPTNVHYIPNTETPSGWVKAHMQKAARIAVTPDSVSMVYEALTSGRPVHLFEMTPKKRNRIVRGIEALQARGMVHSLDLQDAPASTAPPIWEAERAAQWLLERYQHYKTNQPATKDSTS